MASEQGNTQPSGQEQIQAAAAHEREPVTRIPFEYVPTWMKRHGMNDPFKFEYRSDTGSIHLVHPLTNNREECSAVANWKTADDLTVRKSHGTAHGGFPIFEVHLGRDVHMEVCINNRDGGVIYVKPLQRTESSFEQTEPRGVRAWIRNKLPQFPW